MICLTSYTGKQFLPKDFRDSLIVIMLITMVLNIFLNAACIYSLVATKQLHNLSLKLILYLCISDFCLALFGQSVFTAMLSRSAEPEQCDMETIVEFVVYFFCHTSAYIIVIIGYDRYFRLKYLNRYSEFVRPWKIYVALTMAIIPAFLQSAFQVIGIRYQFYQRAKMIGGCIDLVIIMMMIVPYFLSIFVVKNHRRHAINQHLLKAVDKATTAIACRTMFSILILYTPYVIFEIMKFVSDPNETNYRKNKWFNFCVILGYQLAIANSFINSIIFISFNKKTQHKLFHYFVTREELVKKKETSKKKAESYLGAERTTVCLSPNRGTKSPARTDLSVVWMFLLSAAVVGSICFIWVLYTWNLNNCILLSGYIKVDYEVEVIRLPSYVLFKQFCPSLGFNSFTYRTKRKYNTPEDKIKFSF